MFSLAQPQSVRRGARRALHINAATSTRSALALRLGANASNALLFLRLLRSPGHLTFVTANVALLVHLQLLSTRRRMEEQQLKFASDRDELVNFDDVVHDLDSQNEELQNQILKLKQVKRMAQKPLNEFRKSSVSRDGLMSPHIMAQQLRQSTQMQNQELLAKKYIKDRATYKKLAQTPEVVEKLFPDVQELAIVSNNDEPVALKDDPTETSYTKLYASTIQDSLMLLSNMIIKQFLVELNLRKALGDKGLLEEYPIDSYMTENEFFKHLNRRDRSDIDYYLTELADDDAEAQLSDILDDLSHSEAFSDESLRREDIYHYKSGHWLNYMDSDTTNHIQSDLYPRFLSPVVNDEEYISKLKSLFAAYKSDSHPFKHANLALEVAKMLAIGGKYSPSLSIFRVLLDKFGEIGLYNYQALVHDTLPSFENIGAELLSEGVDADAATQELYKKLIEKDPQYLKSLINFESRKENVANLKFLLNYLEPAALNKATLPNFMPLFLSKVSGAKETIAGAGVSTVDLNTIESAINACAKLGDHERIDRILLKLISQLAPISMSADTLPQNARNFSQEQKSNYQELLSDKVLLTLGEIFIRREDKVRLAWLSPLVAARLKKNGSEGSVQLVTLGEKLEALAPSNKVTPIEVSAAKKSVVSRSNETSSAKLKPLTQTRRPSSSAKPIQINSSKKTVPSGLSVSTNLGFADRAVSMAA